MAARRTASYTRVRTPPREDKVKETDALESYPTRVVFSHAKKGYLLHRILKDRGTELICGVWFPNSEDGEPKYTEQEQEAYVVLICAGLEIVP